MSDDPSQRHDDVPPLDDQDIQWSGTSVYEPIVQRARAHLRSEKYDALESEIEFLDTLTPEARDSRRAGLERRGYGGILPTNPEIVEAMTDASHAERFAQAFSLDVRYDHRRERWLIYREPIWRPDNDGLIYRLAIQFARMRQADSLEIRDKKLREQAIKYFINAESKTSLDRTIALARNLKPITDTGDGWDFDPMVLGCPNGIVDLKSGGRMRGDPALRVTMSARVNYDREATCPRWEQFMREVFSDDEELIRFVQRFVGYGLTGLTTEQVLVFCYGSGANGKGTLMNTLSWILGDYSYNMPFSTVELRQRSAIPNDVAALEKRRWVTASETNDGTRLNESRIKTLTGCDPITARFLHGEYFTFQPVAKFVLAVNHKPTVQDDSYGFWRRIRLVPFERTFTPESKDPQLEKTFREKEAAGILRWAVDGCLAWQQHGLGSAGAISKATDQYQTDSDPLNEFLEQCIDADPSGDGVKASAMQGAYVKWCDLQRMAKQDRLSTKDFGKKLGDRVLKQHTRSGWIYQGIKLITNNLYE